MPYFNIVAETTENTVVTTYEPAQKRSDAYQSEAELEAEFIRQLCKGKTPKPQPSKEFWELLNTLYSVHNGFQKCAKYEPSALEICKEIECLILDLQEAG